MMIRFFEHGTGAAKPAIDYLLNDEVQAYRRDRSRIKGLTEIRDPAPQLVDGDDQMTSLLIDSNHRKWVYTSGVIAFEKSDCPTPEQEQAVRNGFEKAAFAGLENDQYDILWVRHSHKQNIELHFVVPRVELRSGKSLNIAPPGNERFFNAFRDYWNAKQNWASPIDLERKRSIKPALDFSEHTSVKEGIKSNLTEAIEAGQIKGHEDVLLFLGQIDEMEFKPRSNRELRKRAEADAVAGEGGKPREPDQRITMRQKGKEGAKFTYRLEDRIFHEDWTAEEYFAIECAREAETKKVPATEGEALVLKEKLEKAVEARRDSNRKRYGPKIMRRAGKPTMPMNTAVKPKAEPTPTKTDQAFKDLIISDFITPPWERDFAPPINPSQKLKQKLKKEKRREELSDPARERAAQLGRAIAQNIGDYAQRRKGWEEFIERTRGLVEDIRSRAAAIFWQFGAKIVRARNEREVTKPPTRGIGRQP